MEKKYKYSKERRDAISEGTKKAMSNPKIRKKISLAKTGKPSPRKGIIHSEISKKKMSEASKGQIAWNKGRTDLPSPSQETIEKRRIKMVGKDNPAWKGGITPENTKIRQSIEYRLWREAIFARDNWTCQKTGVKGDKLHCHHIKNFAQYPELRFAIDNGITLSKKSHKEFHKLYGIKNNTIEQIEEFIEKPLAVIKG